MSTDNCKKFLIFKYPASKDGDWKRVKKFNEGSLSIREFENKSDGTTVQLSESKTGEIKVFIAAFNSNKNPTNAIKAKPNFDCVLVATALQKTLASDYLEQYRDMMCKADFEKLKFMPQNYHFQIVITDNEEGEHGCVTNLDCNKTMVQLKTKGIEFNVAITNRQGTWYDGAEENFLCNILCPTIFSSGGSEGTIEIDDDTLTPNDVIAFLERRGLVYQDNCWNEINMKNFRSKVNDNHVWAYPNQDLTPTVPQMWELVKSHMYDFPIYKNYMNTDMIEYYLENDKKNYSKDLKKELRDKITIVPDKENIKSAIAKNTLNNQTKR